MFDAVLRRETLPKRRFGAGAAIALSLWTALAVVASWLRPDAPQAPREVPVTFVHPPPAPAVAPPPSPDRAARPRAVAQRPPVVRPLVAPTAIARAPEPAPPPPEPPRAEAGGPAAAEGEPGQALGGTVGGGVAAAGSRLDFDDRMTPPVKISGPDPLYTERALEREVEGTMIVRCVVTVDGAVFGCRILKGLPFMNGAVIDALERRRYRPATLGGRPVEVSYDFKITLRLR